MTAPVYVSSGAFASRRLSDILAMAQARGLAALELSSDIAHDPAAAATAAAAARAARGRFALMPHNYFPAPADPFVLNLAAADPTTRRRSEAHCCDGLRLAAELGAPAYSAHGGFAVAAKVEQLGRGLDLSAAAPLSEAAERFAESVDRVLAVARAVGVRFLIENNVLEPVNAPDGVNRALLMVEAEEMAAFARDRDPQSFGYLIDVGHLNVSARTLGFSREAFLETLAPWIGGFHLSDNDGRRDANRPFGADAWFLPWLARFPAAFCVIEAYGLDDADLRRCLAAVNSALDGDARPRPTLPSAAAPPEPAP